MISAIPAPPKGIFHLIIKKSIKKTDFLNWPREIKMAKQLWGKCPNEQFWVKKQQEDFPSLAYYLTGIGLTELNKAYRIFLLDIKPPERYAMEDAKIGQDIEIEKPKFKTLRDFLS